MNNADLVMYNVTDLNNEQIKSSFYLCELKKNFLMIKKCI